MDAREEVRADLAARVTAIGAKLDCVRANDLARDLDQVRTIAHRHEFRSAAAVAQILFMAVASPQHRGLLHEWLPVLADAILSARNDSQAASTYAAACSVRLAG